MRCTDPAADVKLRNPMTGSLPGCRARAASGHAAAALPTSMVNSRRFREGARF